MQLLYFQSNFFVYLLAYIILPLIFLMGLEKKDKQDINLSLFLEKKQTDAVKGISMVMIFLHHFTQLMEYQSLMYPFIFVGYISVAVFFFFSGFGLMSSFQKNEKPIQLKCFLIKRVARIYIPFIVANIFLGVLSNLLSYNNYSALEIISQSFVLQNIILGKALWFINSILFFYFSFFLSLKYFKKNNAIKVIFATTALYILVCVILGLGNWWYNTAFAFPFGVLFAYKKESFFKLIKNNYLILAVLVSFFFLITFVIAIFFAQGFIARFMFESLAAILFICAVIIFLYKIDLNSKFFSFVGKISLEIYLIHSSLFQILYSTFPTENSISIIVVFVITLLVAYFLSQLSSVYIFKKIKEQKR